MRVGRRGSGTIEGLDLDKTLSPPSNIVGRRTLDMGVIGFDFGCQFGRSEPWSPEPRSKSRNL